MLSKVLDKYRAFALDLDGVVWRGEQMLEGSAEALSRLVQSKKELLLLTNNGILPPQAIVERLNAEGVQLRDDQVLTSAMVAKDWLVANGLGGQAAFFLASPSVEKQFTETVRVVPVGRGRAGDVAVVVVGRDLEFNFERLDIAAKAVRGGARLIALNGDVVMPVEGGLEPGTGALVAAIEAASGCEAVVIGKPHMPMMQAAAARLGDKGVLMVGDRAESDVVGARAVGWDAALVLSGADAAAREGELAPDYVAANLAELIRRG